jgi:DNA-binding winged helix-turn-helix (wHTH) protein
MQRHSQEATMSEATSREPVGRKADERVFGPFRLDVQDERLWRGDRELKLRRKPFAILKHLTANPRRLVTHDELLEAVWGKIVMSESLLRTHICDVRRVLGEGLLETVVGRGYRFLHDVVAETRPVRSLRQVEAPPTPRVVGLGEEMALLRSAFDKALGAAQQMVFIAGDPGVAKTALVDAFLAEIAELGTRREASRVIVVATCRRS